MKYPPEIALDRKQFLDDLLTVYETHGLALGHEDTQGAFTIVNLDDDHRKWLSEAQWQVTFVAYDRQAW